VVRRLHVGRAGVTVAFAHLQSRSSARGIEGKLTYRLEQSSALIANWTSSYGLHL